MAYNLQSLITILDQLLDPEQTIWILGKHKPRLQSLLKKTTFLQQILEKSSLPKIESLEIQIRDVVHKAEDIIESDMVDRMSSTSEHESFTLLAPDVQQVAQELESLTDQVVKLVEEKKALSPSSGGSLSGASVWSLKSDVVGVDADLMQLKDRLTGTNSKLEIVPIVGMGGIGKTTLARKLYQDPSIVCHFQSARAWTTISQDYNIREIILSLLGCIIGNEVDQHKEKGIGELKDILYRSLFCKSYLIVLDDIWSTKFWDEMRRCFPDSNNGSRIVVTTRESDVAKSADSKSRQHQVQLLSKFESWNLLKQIVFGGEDCPSALEKMGTKMASDCGGLPLGINVIGGVLSKVERSEDVWENIGKDVGAAIAESGEQFSGVLSLSYNHLPNHLKPCFLYMGAFPEDYYIKGSRLVRMWVAEGFVKPSGDDKSLEEVGEDWLKGLVERNLVSVRDRKCNGKPKGYNMHDILRDLCIRKAEEDKFLHVCKNRTCTFSNPRRVSVNKSEREDFEASTESMSLARSFIGIGRMDHFNALFELKLLRVLDLLDLYFRHFPTGVLQLLNLRYLALNFHEAIPSEISRLCNLQTFIAMTPYSEVPHEVLEMPELRYLKVRTMMRLDYRYMRNMVQRKLQGIPLMCVTSSLERDFFKSFPNIRKLGINKLIPSRSSYFSLDLSHLHKLETLTCQSFPGDVTLTRIKFPPSIKKLSLAACLIRLPLLMKTLCGLPNLEVLMMRRCIFQSEGTLVQEWEAEEGDEFPSLQYLSLDRMKLVRWRADETNFPRLRHLKLSYCNELEEIPSGIGEIMTLQLIQLDWCSASADASAIKIQEVQQSDYANYQLDLRINQGNEWV